MGGVDLTLVFIGGAALRFDWIFTYVPFWEVH